MAVIWGLDLKELQWGKFKGSYMFNQVYYLRRTKMIVYQIAVILCIVSESILTSVLSSYVDQQHHITTRSHAQAHVHNSDFVGIASYNVIIGIAVPVIFGAGFFLDLFWPERRESKSVKLAWKICSIVVSFMALADAIALTIVLVTRRVHITGVSTAEASFLFTQNGPPTPIYRHNGKYVASVVILWPGVVASFASTYIMWKSLQHNEALGPLSLNHQSRGGEAKAEMTTTIVNPTNSSATNGGDHQIRKISSVPAL